MAVLNSYSYGGPTRSNQNTGYIWQADPDIAAQGQVQERLQRGQLAAARYPHDLQQGRFNQVFPMLQNALGQWSSSVGGGPVGVAPRIDAGPVWSHQDVQRQVNAARAQTDQATAARVRQNQAQLAGRGFGSRSPLLAALNQSAQNQGLAANTANERELRLQSRQQNAQHVLRAQTAREGQYASRQQEDIERRRTWMGGYNALVAALAGLV